VDHASETGGLPAGPMGTSPDLNLVRRCVGAGEDLPLLVRPDGGRWEREESLTAEATNGSVSGG
jgi:hypothetical protein